MIRSFLRLAGAVAFVAGAPVAGAQAAAASAGAPAEARAAGDSSVIAPAAWRGAGPNGATLRCRDGSYPAPKAPDSACEGKGGVLSRFPLLPVPGRAPAPAAVQAPPRQPSPTARKVPDAPPSRANVLVPAQRPPADATLLCRDGTIIQADTAAVRCASHGGLRGRFSPARPR